MKVRCIKLLGAREQLESTSSWLTVGKVYDVLSLEFESKGPRHVRLVGDGRNGVALFPLESFEVVSATIPLSWVACWNADGLFQLAPSRWMQDGFWEKYYDGDPEIIQLFEIGRKEASA